MSSDNGQDPSSSPDPGSVADIEAKIEETREHLAETVDALSAKADVKARAGAKADELRTRAQDAVTDDAGALRPVVPVAAGAALLLVVLVVVWRRRRR